MARRTRSGARCRAVAILTLSWLLAACGASTVQQVRYDTRSGVASSTPDGLQRIRTSRIGAVFVKPGADLSAYDRVVIAAASLSPGQPSGRSESVEHPPMDAEAVAASQERMKQIVQEAIDREFAQSTAYAVSNDAGPGALRVTGAVLDFVLDTRQSPGGEWSVGGPVGDMTLVLDVRDAATGQPLARFVERPDLRLQTGAGGVAVQGPGSVWSLVRRVVAQWSRASREELDVLHDTRIPPLTYGPTMKHGSARLRPRPPGGAHEG